MNIYRAKHDNVPESPVRTLYGRKGNTLILPLDICILQVINGREELRPSPEVGRLVAAPIQEEVGGRIGLVAQYDWPPPFTRIANPVVLVQLAPSANLREVEDLRVLAPLVQVGDPVICTAGNIQGKVVRDIGWCNYPDNVHKVEAYRVEFSRHIDRRAHGAAVRLKGDGLIGMLIATQNEEPEDGQVEGVCRALVFPA